MRQPKGSASSQGDIPLTSVPSTAPAYGVVSRRLGVDVPRCQAGFWFARDGLRGGHLMEPDPIRNVLDAALGYHRAGLLAEAEALYRRILERDPGHAGAWHLLGVVAQQQGRDARAVEWIGRAIALDPDRPIYR